MLLTEHVLLLPEEGRAPALAKLHSPLGVDPAECMVPNKIACSHDWDLDLCRSSKRFHSTSSGTGPLKPDWQFLIEGLRRPHTEERHAGRKKTFG